MASDPFALERVAAPRIAAAVRERVPQAFIPAPAPISPKRSRCEAPRALTTRLGVSCRRRLKTSRRTALS